ncbi:hypothetical protein ABZU32_28735 [Sphaerisporangium sp. NPDC005288]
MPARPDAAEPGTVHPAGAGIPAGWDDSPLPPLIPGAGWDIAA